MAQTQVAVETEDGSGGGLKALCVRAGGVALARWLESAAEAVADGEARRDARFEGFGTMVIFGDDLKKRAVSSYVSTSLKSNATELARGAFRST